MLRKRPYIEAALFCVAGVLVLFGFCAADEGVGTAATITAPFLVILLGFVFGMYRTQG